mmetsp:Transcript_1965/g.5402  ORF Transcript_1965/g.5402 Transcript_1965/m.5402 type:complete len:286 (-) Transcript_1965:681-1538(-)
MCGYSVLVALDEEVLCEGGGLHTRHGPGQHLLRHVALGWVVAGSPVKHLHSPVEDLIGRQVVCGVVLELELLPPVSPVVPLRLPHNPVQQVGLAGDEGVVECQVLRPPRVQEPGGMVVGLGRRLDVLHGAADEGEFLVDECDDGVARHDGRLEGLRGEGPVDGLVDLRLQIDVLVQNQPVDRHGHRQTEHHRCALGAGGAAAAAGGLWVSVPSVCGEAAAGGAACGGCSGGVWGGFLALVEFEEEFVGADDGCEPLEYCLPLALGQLTAVEFVALFGGVLVEHSW